MIAAKENSGILKSALKGLEHEAPRTQIGSNYSLRRLISSDLKNYMDRTHIVFDISAFEERGGEFSVLLEELRAKHEKAKIILYCYDCHEAGFFDLLARKGFTNIIAEYPDESEAENLKLINQDLAECFTDSGLAEEKYKRFIIESVISNENCSEPAAEDNQQAVDLSGSSTVIAIFGSQNRIGATTFASRLCEYAAANGGKAALILCGAAGRKEYDKMRKYLDIPEDDMIISFNGYDALLPDNADKAVDYNLYHSAIKALAKGEKK